MTHSKLSISLIQMRASADPSENLDRASKRIRRAAETGSRVICLQELFQSLYFCQTEDEKKFDLAEEIPGPATDRLTKLAEELNVVIIAPIFEKRARGIYHNSACVIDAGGKLLGVYRKMHIPDDPSFFEKFYFAPGDLGFRTFQTRYAKIGLLICWDQWFPEAARICALQGAEILFYPSAIGWHAKESREVMDQQLTNWTLIHQAHAVNNGVFVAAVNRCGPEGELNFWGNSLIAGPSGRMIAKGGIEEEIVTGHCDLSEIETVRRHWPFFRDRRIDAYQPLTARYLP